MSLRPSTPEDADQIIDLLARAFSVDRSAPFLAPDLVRWKYWAVCDDWPEDRSWVVERDGCIIAHGALWPVTVRTAEGGSERGISMLDWAADKDSRGQGVLLMKHLVDRYAFSFCIGGTAATQSILPRLNYNVVGEALTWARPLRPLRKTLRFQLGKLRSPIEVARKIRWAMKPSRTVPPALKAVLAIDGAADPPFPVFERDEGYIRFLAQCPGARCLRFHIMDDGRKVGWFSLLAGRVQARVVGIWLEDSTPENWRTAFCLAQSAALEHTGAYEIVARSGPGESSTGAEQSGMKVRKRVPVYLIRKGNVPQTLPLHFQLSDDDAIFLNIEVPRFLT